MMRLLVLSMLCAAAVPAAVIRGSAVEHTTGKPLARAVVALQPVAGTPASPATVRTNIVGGFEFGSLPGGAYIVTVSRAGFVNFQAGQKDWKSAGHPIVLEESAVAFVDARLRRFGAISGMVLDEEEIGLPDHDVVVYRNTRPPKLLTRTRTDDRGVYRLAGLMPDSYLVRTAGKQYDDASYLPAFHLDTQEVEQANGVAVMLDDQANIVNIKPKAGRLVSISGSILTPDLSLPVAITLASDIGRLQQQGLSFHFDNMPPGKYELYAQTPGDAPRFYAGYITFAADQERNSYSLQLVEMGATNFQIQGDQRQRIDARKSQIHVRRKDLAGTAEPIALKPGQQSIGLAPGRWEVLLTPPPEYCVFAFSGPRYSVTERSRPDGWNEIFFARPQGVTFTLSSAVAGVRGVVTDLGQAAVGAPVFLEAWDARDRKRGAELRETRTDLHGQFSFSGLSPGTYRILSTFEYQTPDSSGFEAAGAKSITLEKGQTLQLDLAPYVIR